MFIGKETSIFEKAGKHPIDLKKSEKHGRT
jgi:hypothetical protein